MAKKKSAKREAPTPLRLPDDIKSLIAADAQKEDRSFNYIVVKILKKHYKLK